METYWTKPAKRDLELIHAYISRDNKAAALKVIKRIYNSVHTQLMVAPLSGRLGRIKNTRELVFSDIPYIVAYRVESEKLIIVRVLHTSLQWPDNL
jgi:toxin ParE1/3/4